MQAYLYILASLLYLSIASGCDGRSSDADAPASAAPAQTSGFSMSYGGASNDLPFALRATSDGGVVVGGYTESFGEGSRDSLFFKLDHNGSIQWQYTMGGPLIEDVQSIAQAPDGGYLLCGYTQSYGQGEYDMWLVKLDEAGTVLWQKSYGGAKTEFCKSAEYTSENNLIVAGYTGSWGQGTHDVWVLKLDTKGDILWQRAYGTPDVENTYSIHQTTDGGYLISGHVHLLSTAEQLFLWVLKLDAEGNPQWQNIYGGVGFTHTTSGIEASSGGYMISAYSDMGGAGGYDVMLMRLTNEGGIVWANYYGSADDDYAYVVRETSPGEFMVTGGAGSDMLTMSVDDRGSLTGWRQIGGAGEDISSAYSIAASSDGTLFAAAKSTSWGLGGYDIWVLSHQAGSLLTNDSGVIVTTASPGIIRTRADVIITDAVASPTIVAQKPVALETLTVPVLW